jgi:acyl-CoA dehydrogenase
MIITLMKFLKRKKIFPEISSDEKQLLTAGTTWFDSDIFKGKIDFSNIINEPYDTLTAEEQAYLDGPVEELCVMLDGLHYEMFESRVIPESIWTFATDNKFLAMKVPKKYGGLEFTPLGISTILQKLIRHGGALSYIIIVNSSVAVELLVQYGTAEQKKEYLPKLATGELMISCAGTEATTGSDPTSLNSIGVIFKDIDDTLKIKLNFNKRFITLAPIADIILLVFKLSDPDNLLGKGEDLGVTIAIIHRDLRGISIGNHHLPIGDPIYNGPIRGKDVIISINDILGGPDNYGQSFNMFASIAADEMAISTPSDAMGLIKMAVVASGAYSMIRHQFGIPIGTMEGVIEKLGRMAALTYALDATRVFLCTAIGKGHKPIVFSEALKVYASELARQLVTDGMDIFAGAAVMQGPNNILSAGYFGAPISVVVYAPNITSRSLIILAEGLTLSHPYAYKLMSAVDEENTAAFRSNSLKWVGHFILLNLRKTIHTLTRGLTVKVPVRGPTAKYYRRLGWASSRFAFLIDITLVFIGGKLKTRGMLAGRYADILSWQMIAISALRRFEAEGQKIEDLPLVQFACEYALNEIQLAFEAIYRSLNVPLIGTWMKTMGLLWLKVNPVGTKPSDELTHRVAQTIQKPSPQFDRLLQGTFISKENKPGMGRLFHAFKLMHEAHDAITKVHAAQEKGQLPPGILASVIDSALVKGIINNDENARIKAAIDAQLAAIQVDEFTPQEFFRDKNIKKAPNFVR